MASGKIEREDFSEKSDKIKAKEKTACETTEAAELGEKDRELKKVRRKVTQCSKYLTDTKLRMFDTIEQEIQHWLVTLDDDYQESAAQSFEDYGNETKVNLPLKNIASKTADIIESMQTVKTLIENFVEDNMAHVKDE